LKESVLVTSCGGPAAENVIKNLKLVKNRPKIYGIDVDPWMAFLSSADRRFQVDRADSPKYVEQLQDLIKCLNISLLIPQSDAEVYTISKQREQFDTKIILPNHYVIKLCQDKGKLYDYLKDRRIPLPAYKNPTPDDIRALSLESPNYGVWSPSQWKYPCWVRARHGAGGNKGFVCRDWRDLRNMVEFYRGREEIDWQMVRFLEGRNLSWTSLWNQGELVTSVLKERLKWVYDRIGTTAIQRTIYNDEVNEYCELIVKAVRELDPKLTGIMMLDMKQDSETKDHYVTEINAGRLGTVNYFYGYTSKEIFGDDRLNFPWLMWLISKGQKLPELPKFNAFPQGLYWLRHIDMGYKLVDNA